MIGTGIANVWARHPANMQGAAATVGSAWPGRFVHGLGVGHAPTVEASGQTYERPLAHITKYLAAMDASRDAAPPTPVPVPRVVAALRPRMLELASDVADGAIPYFVPPSHTPLARSIVGPDKLLLVEQSVVLSTDADEARRTARGWMDLYLQLPNYVANLRSLGYGDDVGGGGSDRLVDAIVAWGDEAAIARPRGRAARQRCRQRAVAGAGRRRTRGARRPRSAGARRRRMTRWQGGAGFGQHCWRGDVHAGGARATSTDHRGEVTGRLLLVEAEVAGLDIHRVLPHAEEQPVGRFLRLWVPDELGHAACLGRLLDVLELPTDRPRPDEQDSWLHRATGWLAQPVITATYAPVGARLPHDKAPLGRTILALEADPLNPAVARAADHIAAISWPGPAARWPRSSYARCASASNGPARRRDDATATT